MIDINKRNEWTEMFLGKCSLQEGLGTVDHNHSQLQYKESRRIFRHVCWPETIARLSRHQTWHRYPNLSPQPLRSEGSTERVSNARHNSLEVWHQWKHKTRSEQNDSEKNSKQCVLGIFFRPDTFGVAVPFQRCVGSMWIVTNHCWVAVELGQGVNFVSDPG